MRFYTSQHDFYCGVDLHARTMYVCVLDQAARGLIVGRWRLKSGVELKLKLVEAQVRRYAANGRRVQTL